MIASDSHSATFPLLPTNHVMNPYLSPPPLHPRNLARLIPTLLTGLPEPFHVSLSSPWMNSPAQTPHQLTDWYMAITPINGMTLPSQWEPNKRIGDLLTCHIHRPTYP
jgi:hypothetical protein